MAGGITDGRSIWEKWEKVLNDFLGYQKTKRYEKLSDKQKKELKYNVHLKLQALNRLAHQKDMAYIKELKNKYSK